MLVIFTKMVISRRGVTYLHSSVHVSCSEHSAACAMTQHKSRSVQMPMILRRFWIKKNPHGSGAQGSRLHCFLVRDQTVAGPNHHQCLLTSRLRVVAKPYSFAVSLQVQSLRVTGLGLGI